MKKLPTIHRKMSTRDAIKAARILGIPERPSGKGMCILFGHPGNTVTVDPTEKEPHTGLAELLIAATRGKKGGAQ